MKLAGKVWKFGDELGATDLVSAKHDKLGMSKQWTECAKHLLEDKEPAFQGSEHQNDILVAGRNFGHGHAHYYTAAIMACKMAGLSGLLAETVSGIFQRAAIDLGVPTLPFPGLAAMVSSGDFLEIDLTTGDAVNLTTQVSKRFKPVSPIILDILDAGGSRNWALRRTNAAPAKPQPNEARTY